MTGTPYQGRRSDCWIGRFPAAEAEAGIARLHSKKTAAEPSTPVRLHFLLPRPPSSWAAACCSSWRRCSSFKHDRSQGRYPAVNTCIQTCIHTYTHTLPLYFILASLSARCSLLLYLGTSNIQHSNDDVRIHTYIHIRAQVTVVVILLLSLLAATDVWGMGSRLLTMTFRLESRAHTWR